MNAHRRFGGLETLETRQLFSVSLSLGGAEAIVPHPTTDVSADNSFGQSGMVMDVNPKNPLQLAGAVQHVGGMNEIDVYYSSNGGNTWTKTVIDNGAAGFNDGTAAGTRFDPAIAFDDNGNLFVAYGNDTGPSTTVVLARSTDGGATFTQFRTLGTATDIYNGTAAEIRGNSEFSLATGPDGLGGQAVYLAYINSAIETGLGLDQRVTLASSNTAGSTFIASVIVNNGSISGAEPGNSEPDVAVGPSGQVYVVWHDVNIDTAVERVMFDRDLDGRFASASSFGLDGTVKTFPNGSLSGWLVPASPQRGIDTCPEIAVDRSGGPFNGRVYVSYCDWTSGSNTVLRVARSLTNGGGWSEFTPESSTATNFMPQLAIDQHSGAVALAYYSTKNDVATGNDDVQPFLALSTDGGSTFSNSAISTQTSNEAGGYAGDYSDHIGLAMRDGTAHAFWSSRHGAGTDLDAFTTTIGFTGGINGNMLTINGDEGGVHDDVFSVMQSATNPDYLEIDLNGSRAYVGLANMLDRLTINGQFGTNQFHTYTLPGGGMQYIIDTWGNGDLFSVASLPADARIWLDGSFGNDTFQIGSNGSLASIQNIVALNGDVGNDTLILDDSQDPTPNGYYDIHATSVTGPGFSEVSFGDIENLTLSASSGQSGVTIWDTYTNITVHGDNATSIGISGALLSQVQGAISVDHVGGIVLEDIDNTDGLTYTITDSTVSAPGFGGLTYSSAQSLEVYSGQGNDTVNVNSTAAGVPVDLQDQGGNDTINVNETNPTGPVFLPFGTAGDDTVNVNMDNAGSATVACWNSAYVAHLNIGNGGLLWMWPHSHSVLTVNTLSIPGSGRLDLKDNDMIVDYTGPSPIANIQALLTSGYFASGWTGAGINSSAAADNPSRNTALGFGEASQLGYTSFDGTPVDSTAILIKYTRYGDANLDGKVDTLDFNALAASFGSTNRTWSQADFNFDTITDTLDFNQLAANFGAAIATTSTAAASTQAISIPTLLRPQLPQPLIAQVTSGDAESLV